MSRSAILTPRTASGHQPGRRQVVYAKNALALRRGASPIRHLRSRFWSA